MPTCWADIPAVESVQPVQPVQPVPVQQLWYSAMLHQQVLYWRVPMRLLVLHDTLSSWYLACHCSHAAILPNNSAGLCKCSVWFCWFRYNHYYSSRFGHSCFALKLVAGQRSSLQQQLQSVSLCHLTADTQILSCKNRLHWHVIFLHGSRHLTKLAFNQIGTKLGLCPWAKPTLKCSVWLTSLYC